MNQRSIRGITLGIFLVVPFAVFACGTASIAPHEAGSGDASANLREDTDEIPCAPRLVLQMVCQKCHALPPRSGAPFPLVRRSDVLAMRSGAMVRDLMIEEIEAHRMPLTPITIDDASRDVLLAWLHAGAPAVAPSTCSDVDAAPVVDAASGDADGGPPDCGAWAPPGVDASDASPDAEPDAGPPW